MAAFFPSYALIDTARFPSGVMLQQELVESGYTECRSQTVVSPRSYSKETTINKLRQRYVSTLSLLPEEEFRTGLVRAEQELPDLVEYSIQSLIVSAQIPK